MKRWWKVGLVIAFGCTLGSVMWIHGAILTDGEHGRHLFDAYLLRIFGILLTMSPIPLLIALMWPDKLEEAPKMDQPKETKKPTEKKCKVCNGTGSVFGQLGGVGCLCDCPVCGPEQGTYSDGTFIGQDGLYTPKKDLNPCPDKDWNE